jgi:hypothetical protein
MLPGLEGIFQWTPPGAEEVAIVLNQRTKGALGEEPKSDEVWPWFKVERISGLHDLAAAEDNRDARVGAPGSIARPSKRREKSVTFEGTVMARTLRELRQARDLLAAGFAEVDAEGRMDCSWHPDNDEFAEDPPVFFEARSVLATVPEQQGKKNYNRPFVIGLVMGDGRHFDANALLSGTATTVTTGITYEFT